MAGRVAGGGAAVVRFSIRNLKDPMRVNNTPESAGMCSTRLARLGDWMRRYVDQGKLPGMLTMVARNGDVVFLEAYGWRDVEAQAPVEIDTIFRIYSMTKPVTSVAVMMLHEEGHFQLDAPISDFLPEFAKMAVYVTGAGAEMVTEPARSPITIRQLLTHTSGLTYGFIDDTPVGALYKKNRIDFARVGDTLAEVTGRLGRLPLISHPGRAWNYSVSTDVLARLVEVVSGRSFDRFLHERILDPLGMVDTGFRVPADKLDRFAALYYRGTDGALRRTATMEGSRFAEPTTAFSGGGGLVSTVGDYYRFAELVRRKGALDGVRLLGRKTVEYMTANQLPGDLAAMGQPTFSETSYAGIGFGLGFSVMIDPAKAEVIGSPGEHAWGGMASTAFWIDPVEHLTVILMTQLRPSRTYPLRRELRIQTYQALID